MTEDQILKKFMRYEQVDHECLFCLRSIADARGRHHPDCVFGKIEITISTIKKLFHLLNVEWDGGNTCMFCGRHKSEGHGRAGTFRRCPYTFITSDIRNRGK